MEQVPEIRWRNLVADYETSGKPLIDWCNENNIPLMTFITWRRWHRMKFKESYYPEANLQGGAVIITIDKAGCEISASGPVVNEDLSRVLQGVSVMLINNFDNIVKNTLS